MFRFTDDLLTGVQAIDEEHRKLFQIVNEMIDILKKEENAQANQLILRDFVKKLRAYADEHFAHEETYMEHMNDPELEIQRNEHTMFREMVNEFDVESLELSTDMSKVQNLMNFIVKWLHHHIISSDMMIGKSMVYENKSEDPFAFSKKYRTGIAFVDEEHKKLFEIIGNTYRLIEAHTLHDKYDEIVHVLDELKDYTIFHFSDEEEYMQKIKYENYETHKVLHEAFVAKIREINLDEVDSNQQEYLLGLVDFLLGWLDEHIMKEDKRIPIFFEK